ncbi:sensor histidine kinase [Microvirga antarctica]|uniref:sensor histidine kinase n=1 Tax=Microvirga antarctica TaxID=2819233 RepID=UPI001B3047A0|nr:sensor histidine kinase [Microvirga antarctica]
MSPIDPHSIRALIFAPRGRDSEVACGVLGEALICASACSDLSGLLTEIEQGAGLCVVTDDALVTSDLSPLSAWIERQPAWSDFPFIILTQRGGGVERNPLAARLSEVLGNVTFLERPFHPTTLVSVVKAALRGRRRQYEARRRLEQVRQAEDRLMAALAKEKRSAEHQRLLINELNHRVKNTLTTVQSLAAQTLRTAKTSAEAGEALETRLLALSRAHNVLTHENWEGAELTDVVSEALAPYRGARDERVSFTGPNVRLAPGMALALAMALHELATNAVKYGALSNNAGMVDIVWNVLDAPAAPRLALSWTESDGPPVTRPTRRGFGSRLIERSLARDLDGAVHIDFAPRGVICTLNAPLA